MADLSSQVQQLRGQGLTDNLILNELTKQGNTPEQVHTAITQLDSGGGMPAPPSASVGSMPTPHSPMMSAPSSGGGGMGNIYERIEEITESMIDEKWDDLIAEVKKIIEWKSKVEEKQTQMINDLAKLKEDFKVLHQGVLGKIEEYDRGIKEVGTELKAVGKVFKDVIPEFVDNVKELSNITNQVKQEKEE